MEENKFIFALDIGTRSVVGVVGGYKDGDFTVLDYEQEFHAKRAMRDGQIEDIDLVAQVANKVKSKLEERTGQIFDKVSIAAAGRSLKTAAATFSHELIPNEAITDQVIQFMEYSAIELAQDSFIRSIDDETPAARDYYCVGYSVKEYRLDDYQIKNLKGQKGHTASVSIIAAFLPASVLIGLYAVMSKCNLEVDNLTLEPIAAIHAVVPDDVRFLNIALVDIGGGTSDIAISKDGSIIAYDMATVAGDEVTESIMKSYLTNFATAEKIKMALCSGENIQFKDILGNDMTITPEEAYQTVEPTLHSLAQTVSRQITDLNQGPPAAVFLVGGGSQIKNLPAIFAKELGMAENRVAVGVVNTDSNISLPGEDLYNPEFVTPVGIGVVSSMYRGCDFFAITVNGKRLMLFNHQTIKVIDALVLSGIKPASLISISSPALLYTVNGQRKAIKGSTGKPGVLEVNGVAASIETEIKQGDEIVAIPAENGEPPILNLYQVLSEYGLDKIYSVTLNGAAVTNIDSESLQDIGISYMDEIVIENNPDTNLSPEAPKPQVEVEISKIYPSDEPAYASEVKSDSEFVNTVDGDSQKEIDEPTQEFKPVEIDVMLNGKPIHLLQDSDEPLILMHLLKYSDVETSTPKGNLIIRVNDVDSGYATPLENGDKVIIGWSDDLYLN